MKWLRPALEFAAMYCTAFIAILFYARWREGEWNILAAGLFALVAGVYFAFEQKRSREVTALRWRNHNAEIDAALARTIDEANDLARFREECDHAAEAMSYLSPADFSIFVCVQQRIETGEEDAGFLTVPESPMHRVLQRLERAECAQPRDFVLAHDAAPPFPTIAYELTDDGRANLALLTSEATRKRRVREIIANDMG